MRTSSPQEPARFKRGAPCEAEVLPIELETRFEASPYAARRILGRAKVRDGIVISLATPRLVNVPATS
jgi:hypothetical protein